MIRDPAQELYKKRAKELDLERSVDAVAMWAFGFAIAPFIIGFIPVVQLLSFITIPVAFILGCVAVFRIKGDKQRKGMGFAVAAIVLATVELFVVGLFVLAAGLLLSQL